jgi:PAS domain S-box-containing protein
MSAPRPSDERIVSPDEAVTGWRLPDRERDRLVALHRVSTLVAQQRRADDVLREALQCAVSLVGGDAGAMHRWVAERDVLECVVAYGRHEPVIRPELPPGEGLTGRAFVEQSSMVENDYPASPAATPWSVEAGLRTGVAVPISHGGRRIGVLSVGSFDATRTLDADDVELLELFATMVAVALENAEINAELENRLERIRTLSRLTRLVSTSLDLDYILPRIARAAAELTGATFATFWVADEGSRMLRLGGISDAEIARGLGRREMPYGAGAAGWVAEHLQSLTIDNVFEDGRSLSLDWWRQMGMKTSLTVPVMHGTRLLAVLSLNGREPFRLNVPELEVLESFLAQAAAAIRNASLYSTVRRGQEQLQQIMDHSPAGISLKDRDGRFLLTNRRWRELYLYAPGQDQTPPIGKTDADIFPADRAVPTRQRDQDVLASGRPIEYEIGHQVGTEVRTYLSVKFPLVDPAGQPYAVCTITSDITERKRWEEEISSALETQRAANEQLERLNKAKSDFVSIVSHEFRSPLTGIQGFSELIRDEITDIDEMREYSADINREAERLNRMIDELLDLDRMESGQMTLRFGPVDLGTLVSQLVSSLGPRATRHRLRLALAEPLPSLTGDEDKLTQVVVNLLDNAIKYSPDGGEIVVGAEADGGQIHLWVQDQGLGIPADALETVFDRYTRVETAQHHLIRGTGLGLPIVRQIVELHGGRIWVESTPGEGSTFHVTVPLGRRAADRTGSPRADDRSG